MAYYVLLWNPKVWTSGIADAIEKFKKKGWANYSWATGTNKSIKKGDNFFFVRVGNKDPGILGYGVFTSDVTQGGHWDEEKYKKGLEANYADIEFKVLDENEEAIIKRDELKEWFPQKKWFLGASGYSLEDSIGEEIKKIIDQRRKSKTGKNKPSKTQEKKKIKLKIVEGKKTEVKLERYERSGKARIKCIKELGLQCKVCGFDFEKTYGEIGKGFIQVHHIKELSKEKKEHKVDPVKDLIPICPNCHAMIHRKKPALKIEELKKILKK
ncbi:MAG: HNH endonuclease [Thermoanaerobaculia bacterium]